MNVSDDELLRLAPSHAGHERAATAALLADLAEIDARRLYAVAGYASLVEYCTGALKLAEDAAYRRIHAARAARRFPAIYAACADGRLSLTAVNQLAPHLTEANADELLSAAAGLTKCALAALIVTRYPRTESIEWVVPAPHSGNSLALARVDGDAHERARREHTDTRTPLAPARVTQAAATRYALQCMLGEAAHEALRFAQDTRGTSDASAIVEAALLLYAAHLRKRTHAATAKPQRSPRPTTSARHVPAHVRRAVWERDGGRCTFTSDDGHRCGSRRRLEFDHVVPVARGGESTTDNVRLRCRSHNQLEAERVFGAAFMHDRRDRAAADAAERAAALARQMQRDVVAALVALGYRRAKAEYAAASSASLPHDATLDQRVRHALRQVLPPHTRVTRADLDARFHAPPAAPRPGGATP